MAKEDEDEKKAKKGKKGKKAPEPEKPKRSLKGTSRLFMGFRDRTPKISKKGQFRSASAFFWGLHKGPQKTKRKKKARTVLKSTSKLMTQMRVGKKKRAMKGKKPSFMVIRFPGRRGYGRLRPRAQSLSKASTAINWLTKKFLIKKAEESGSTQASLDAWLDRSGSRVGSRKLPFPSGAEILRPGGRLRRFPRAHSIYASGEPVGFLPFEDEAPFRHSGSRRSLYGLEGFQDLGEYYDYHREGDDYYDQQSLYRYEEEQEPLQVAYGPHGPAWPPYDYAHRYVPEDPYDYYGPDYYSGSFHPDYTFGYRYGYDDYEPPYAPPSVFASPYSYYDAYAGEVHPHSYYPETYAPPEALYPPYPPYDLGYELPYAAPHLDPYAQPYGVPFAEGTYGGAQAVYPPEGPYLPPQQSAFAYPWVPPPILSPHNPYAHPMDDIAELEEPEEAGSEQPATSFRLPSAAFFEQQGMDKPARSKLSLIRRFRLFPRPQVKLFGKEKLEVPLPPSLDIPLPLGDADEDEEEDEMPPLPPGPYGHPFWGFLTSRQRHLQRALSAFGGPRGLGFSPDFSRHTPRPATSLARFLKNTLSEKEPIPRLRGSRKAQARGPAVREAAYKRFGYKLAGMDSERPSTPIVLRRAQARARNNNNSHRPATPPRTSRLRPSPIPGPAPTPTLAPPLGLAAGLPPAISPYSSLRLHPPPWAAPAHVPLAPQASWRALAEAPPLIPEGLPDPLAFPGPRPSFRGSRHRGAAFGFPGPSPQPSLRSRPGLGYCSPLGPLSPQPSIRAIPFRPPFSPPPRRPHSLREPPSPRRASPRSGALHSPLLGPPRPPSPPPLLGSGPRHRSLNLPSRLPRTWRRLSEPPTRAVKPRPRQPFLLPQGPGSWHAAAAAPERPESQGEPEDSEIPWTVPPLAPSWDVDMPATQRPPSPWPGGPGSLRGFSRPPPVPSSSFLQHGGPVPSPAFQAEDLASDSTRVFLGRHQDPGPGQLTESASPSPKKPEEEAFPGDAQTPTEPEPPAPTPSRDVPSDQKALRLSLSNPLAASDQMRATWPPWRRWGTLPSAPAPLTPKEAPGPLPKAGERFQASPGRFAVVMPRIQKLSSFQRAGPAPLQPPVQLTQEPEPIPRPRAWSLLWSRLWLPVEAHQPQLQVPTRPLSCRLGPGAAGLPHGSPLEEVGTKGLWSKVWGHRSEGGLGPLRPLSAQQTYIGSILVSVNPYQMFGIYGPEQVQQGAPCPPTGWFGVMGQGLPRNPLACLSSHLFAIANLAFAKMLDAKQNQCIIISGESGSGKTEATKLILRYLAAMSQKRGVTRQILEATPLLESFGNAKTVRNDNSSRFGKFVEIFLEGNERNYHIFYELLAGLPAQLRQAFSLQEAETYYYLNQGGNCEISGKSDADDFRRLLAAMEVLGFSAEDQDSIFRILASILHLGNVYFEKDETDAQEVASVVSAREIQAVAELLQVSPEGLQKAITFKVTATALPEALRLLTVPAPSTPLCSRDAIAKVLYALLFSWLIARVNALVSPQKGALSIAVLDIYGFEDLSFNSFEQLCINYANESLQYLFNKIIFQEEQVRSLCLLSEYMREQIDWREVTFTDNQPCINLLSLKPYGILRILDDQCCFPQVCAEYAAWGARHSEPTSPLGPNHTFLQKCHYHHGANPLYSKPKMPLPEFTIKHYAGKVTYQVHKFLDKNHDQVRQDVLDLFVRSRTRVVAHLFSSHAPQAAPQRLGKSSSISRLYKAHTVAAKFQQSLLDLVEKMERWVWQLSPPCDPEGKHPPSPGPHTALLSTLPRCNPLFVRCLKPNHKKEPGLFECDVVTAQLRYSGLLETVRIRKEGFPVRLPFQVFIDRYRCLVALQHNLPASGDMCVSVLSRLCTVTPNMYCVGVSKLFLKEHLHQLLEGMRDHVLSLAAVTLQRCLRGFFVQRRFRSLRRKIILLQSRARGYLARCRPREGRPAGGGVAGLSPHPVLTPQELSKRQVVAVGHLEVPVELAGLLRAVAGTSVLGAVRGRAGQGARLLMPPLSTGLRTAQGPRVALVRTPRLRAEPRVTLPLDINNYPMAKFVRCHFKEPAFGMLTVPLRTPLTRLPAEYHVEAVGIFKLILRFMGDPQLHGARDYVFGSYIVQKGLAVPELRDEILAQLANQVWRNPSSHNAERGWLLLAACLSGFAPSPRLDKYLLNPTSELWAGLGIPDQSQGFPHVWLASSLLQFLPARFVSDHGQGGFQAVCQHRLMQAMVSGAARTFPPTQLEWTATQEKAGMALDVGCFNGDLFSCPVQSWSTGEEVAGDILRHRGLVDGWRGWTVAMKNGVQWAELAGHDYVLDLVSDLELLREFPRRKAYFLVGAEGPPACRGGLRVFGNSWDSDDDAPTKPQPQGLVPVVADSDGYCSHNENGTNGETEKEFEFPPTQPDSDSLGEPAVPHKGLDCYLDSLFDPVLSCGDADLEKPTAIAYRMKGGGQPGGDGSSSTEGPPRRPPEPKPSQCILQQTDVTQEALLTLCSPQKPLASEARPKFVGTGLPAKPVLLRSAPKPVAPAPLAKAPRPPTKPVAAPILPQGWASPESSECPIAAGASQDGTGGWTHLPPIPCPATASPCLELVRSSTLNSEHFPQPTQQIKDIVRQHQQLPRGCQPEALRKDGGRVFVKRPDPHEEALTILRGQMSPPVAAPGTQAGGGPSAPTSPSLGPASPALPSRSLEPPEDSVQTQLHRLPNPDFYGYRDTPWQIFLRKENQLDTQRPLVTESVKRAVVSAARDSWEVYFSRLFPATGSVGTGVQMLAVSHTGIKLLRVVKGSHEASRQLRVLRTYSFADILFVTIPSQNMLEFNLASEKVILFSARAHQVKTLVDDFILELKKDSDYVVAVRNFLPEDPALLAFHKGDIIHLQPLEPPRLGQRRGVRGVSAGAAGRGASLADDTLSLLRPFPPLGWRFGTIHGRVGRFPSDLVQPAAAPDFLQLPAEPGRGRAAAVAAAVASTAAAREVGRRREGPPVRAGSMDRGEDGLALPPYTMLEFAQKYFRDPQRRPQDHEVMRDECYCQVMKQITDNTSTKQDSCQRGWRLLYIVAAYHSCSEVLQPHLTHFLQDVSRTPGLPFQGIAKACEQNLKKTLRFGGRLELPGSMELRAMLAGRSSKRQLFLLPGGLERHLKIKTCTVALDVVEELCAEMALTRPEAFDEYVIFVVTNRGQHVCPLSRRAYILDVASEMAQVDGGYALWFRRVLWDQPLKFDNELYVTMHYNQVLPDYLKGLFSSVPAGRPSEQQLQQVSKLAALQHRAKDHFYLPSAREAQGYIPAQLYRTEASSTWLHLLGQHRQQMQALSPHQARAQFLGLLSASPMFGSSFFLVQSCSTAAVPAPCILAVNQNGLNFLSTETHELMVKFPLKEIQSTRTQRPTAGSSCPYVEVALGDVTAQHTVQLQLEQGLELCRVVAVHVENLLSAREKRLTLPPSEITLL
ncbi:hypothetical protein MG293_016410 [Ovis ammon polii]|uniref:Myosin XVA n=1 Tax=Ovis ammon polii TaxID=230172 RepID=A0AAD4TU22_OVIAM|nr:hypothetical protein MG293_016410 [Ovis ammon polii]